MELPSHHEVRGMRWWRRGGVRASGGGSENSGDGGRREVRGRPPKGVTTWGCARRLCWPLGFDAGFWESHGPDPQNRKCHWSFPSTLVGTGPAHLREALRTSICAYGTWHLSHLAEATIELGKVYLLSNGLTTVLEVRLNFPKAKA